MIALDTNLLVYAHRAESQFHARAAECLRSLAEGRAAWAIPWPCLHEFSAVVTNTRIFSPPSAPRVAIQTIEAWLASPTLQLLAETAEHWATLSTLCGASDIAGARIHDARIAALCLEHGVRELWSADRDFERFPAIHVRNPLIG